MFFSYTNIERKKREISMFAKHFLELIKLKIEL